jgi:hypothetical protein
MVAEFLSPNTARRFEEVPGLCGERFAFDGFSAVNSLTRGFVTGFPRQTRFFFAFYRNKGKYRNYLIYSDLGGLYRDNDFDRNNTAEIETSE